MPDPSTPGAELWQVLDWTPTPEQQQQFLTLQELLREWNGRVNLTRLVEGDDFWINQVFDSLWPLGRELQQADRPLHCIDVGTGGGFPGLAVAIALPHARLTLVDSVGRKTAAVAEMARSLGLSERVSVRTERVETTGRDRRCRGMFDLAMARAVAAAPVVAEYLVPLLQPSGQALLYRGQWSEADGRDLQGALRDLKARITEVQQQQLPGDRGIRHLLRLQQDGPCPSGFPRAVGVPGKLPLGS